MESSRPRKSGVLAAWKSRTALPVWRISNWSMAEFLPRGDRELQAKEPRLLTQNRTVFPTRKITAERSEEGVW